MDAARKELTKEGQELWDNIGNVAENPEFFNAMLQDGLKDETHFRLTESFRLYLISVRDKYANLIEYNQILLKEYTKKEQYFRANEAKVVIFMSQQLIDDVNKLLMIGEDYIEVDRTTKKTNQTYIV